MASSSAFFCWNSVERIAVAAYCHANINRTLSFAAAERRAKMSVSRLMLPAPVGGAACSLARCCARL
eukprot:scaffold259788_cov11-Prasinocladus_malaysianus.AAC.1